MSTCIADFSVTSSIRTLPEVRVAPSAGQILVVDARRPSISGRLRSRYAAAGFRVETVASAAGAVERVRRDPPDVVLIDPDLPDACGLVLHERIREVGPRIPVIFLAAARTADWAIVAMKQGAHDYLFDPIDPDHLDRVIATAMDTAQRRHGADDAAARTTPATPATADDYALRGTCPAMCEVYKSIGLVAAQDVNVLVTGESGTGKELVARAIHRHSARSAGPFLALNCAAIPENLLESELFGHERGAFSGADRRRVGKFEQCDGGTILLDEIGDMPLSLQAKILRLLQDQTFERVGGNETIRTNVRIIASTHRDLKTWAATERFRADLYYRLGVFCIHLPPLRDRAEDLPTLVRHFVGKFAGEMGRDTRDVSDETMRRLGQHRWPGNLRELQSVLRQALLRASGPVLLPNFLPPLDGVPPADGPAVPSNRSATDPAFDVDGFVRQRLGPEACDLYAELHREVDRHALSRVLAYTRGNQFLASRVLGIARQTLRLKLREAGVRVTQTVGTSEDANVA